VTPAEREHALRGYATRWATLRAWGPSLAGVAVEIIATRHARLAGCAWPLARRVEVYATGSLVEDLATVLHEYAHVAARDGGHSARWRALFAASVREVTGLPVCPDAPSAAVLDRACADALRAWWPRAPRCATCAAPATTARLRGRRFAPVCPAHA
jgi:hypothetical protein